MNSKEGLVKGSIVLLVALNVFNALNFLFQFLMVRILSVEEYGVLASLFSFIYIFLVFNDSIQLVVTKYSAGEENKGKIKNLIKRSLKKGLFFGITMFAIYLLVSIPLSFMLDINYFLLFLNGLFIVVVLLTPITRGVIQGKKKFRALGANMILDASLKLFVGVSLTLIGFGVYGAMVGVLVGSITAFAFSFVPLKEYLSSQEKKAETEGIYRYTRPAFFLTLFITAFYSIDILIAKLMFSSQEAGFYAIASTLAKVIFLGTQPISKAMFPISAEQVENARNSRAIYKKSMIMLLLGISVALVAFYLFPEMIIKIFTGKEIKESSSILFYIGLGFGLISLANLNILFNLSVNRVKRYLLLGIFLILEAVLLITFSNSLMQFSMAFVTASILFFIGSLFIPMRKRT